MHLLHRAAQETVTITTPDGYRVKVSVTSFYQNGVLLAIDAHPEVKINLSDQDIAVSSDIQNISHTSQPISVANK